MQEAGMSLPPPEPTSSPNSSSRSRTRSLQSAADLAAVRAVAAAAEGEAAEEGSSGVVLELLGLWVDPELEEQVEVVCCLLYFFLQYLVADDSMGHLLQGERFKSCLAY